MVACNDPASELSVGDTLDLKILKVDKESGRISLGSSKCLRPMAGRRDQAQSRRPRHRRGHAIDRLRAFVEVFPGVEGMIHVSEMSWTKRIQRPGDVLKKGERVEAVVLKIDQCGGATQFRFATGPR
jgi:small subunit ribosomal protein S1